LPAEGKFEPLRTNAVEVQPLPSDASRGEGAKELEIARSAGEGDVAHRVVQVVGEGGGTD
jgi:hypothetical protein